MEDVLESWTAVLFGEDAEAVVESVQRCGAEVLIAAL